MRFATSLQGHDKGTLYMVLGQKDNKVLLCDGKSHPLDCPKAKNPRHIQEIKNIPSEVTAEREKFDKLTNERVAYLIKKYKALKQLPTTEEE